MKWYKKLVRKVQKPESEWVKLAQEMTPAKMKLLQIALGLSGEVGEIVDTIKKHIEYGRPLDKDNLEEEFGDLEWYIHAGIESLGLDHKKILKRNEKKLLTRYKGGYSRLKAFLRKDKEV